MNTHSCIEAVEVKEGEYLKYFTIRLECITAYNF